MKKTASFAIMHVSVAFVVVWAMTGSWLIGGVTALVEPMVNTVAYHFHEKIWARWTTANPGFSAAVAGSTALP